MIGPSPLAALLMTLVEHLVPRERRAEVLGDLCEDYQRVELRCSRWRARAWLCGEVGSLALRWAHARVQRLFRARTVLHRDARLSWRTMKRQPLASAGAAALLGVGIVAVGLTWALGHFLLERPVSGTHGHRVMRIGAIETSGRLQARFSLPELERIEAQLESTASVGAVGLEPALVRSGEKRRHTLAEVIGPKYSEVTGLAVQIGRPLLAIDHDAGATPTVIISDVLWRDLFERHGSALNASVYLNGRAFVIVGVARTAPPSSFLGASVDLWVPLAQADVFFTEGWRTDPARRSLSVFILPRVTRPELEQRLSRATTDLAGHYPEPWRQRVLVVLPGTAVLGTQRTAAQQLFRILLTLAVLVLAVAGANVGGILLAGAAARRREAAIHVAVGAGPGAASRRVLIEGAMLGAAAGVLSWGLYVWARVWLADVTLLPTLSLRVQLPGPLSMGPLLALVGIVLGLLVAAGPALWVARRGPVSGLHQRGPAAGERSMARARRLLIGTQVALALVLLVGATLFGRSLDRLAHADLGIVRDGLLAFDFDIEPHATQGVASEALAAEALRQVRALPGVSLAAMANRAPVDTSTPTTAVARGDVPSAMPAEVTINTVTAGYFETVGTPILRGRSFLEGEVDGTAVVNEALARHLWPDGSALDRQLLLVTDQRSVQVVGIARNASYRTIGESGLPHLYLPTPPAFGHALLVRTVREPRRMLLDVQDTLDRIGPGVVGFFPRTQVDHLAIQLLPTRVASATAAWFGGLAMILSGMGLYGLVMWFVTLRETEMAIRLALGATRRDIRRLVVGQAFATAGPGIVAGVVLSAAGIVIARGLLYGLEVVDAGALVSGIAALAAIVVAASWLPARRAARTDPASALRSI